MNCMPVKSINNNELYLRPQDDTNDNDDVGRLQCTYVLCDHDLNSRNNNNNNKSSALIYQAGNEINHLQL